MPNSRDFRDRELARQTENVLATILSRNSDGSYHCQDVVTQHEFDAMPFSRNDTFNVGSRVIISRPSATRRSRGAGSAIIGRAPQEQRGLTGIARIANSTFRNPIVTDVSYVRLGIGSVVPQELVIRGYYLTTAPTYESAEITDDSAPVVASTSITCQLVASGAATEGTFDVTVHGMTFADRIETYSLPSQLLYMTGDESGVGNYPEIIRIDPATLTVEPLVYIDIPPNDRYATHGISFGEDSLVRTLVRRLSDDSAYLIVADMTAGDQLIVPVTLTGAGLYTLNHRILRKDGANVFASSLSGTHKLYSVTDAGALTTIATLTDAHDVVIWDGTYYWLADSGGSYWPPTGGNDIVRVTAGGAETVVTGITGVELLYHDGYVYAADPDNDTVHKIDPSSATEVSSLAVGGCEFRHLAVSGDYLYASYHNFAGTTVGIKKIALATLTVTSTLTLSGVTGQMAISPDGSTLWMRGDSGHLREIDLVTFTETNDHTLTITYEGSPVVFGPTEGLIFG